MWGVVRKSGSYTRDIQSQHVYASTKLANIRVPPSTCGRRQWWWIALFLFTQHAIVVEKNTYQTWVLQKNRRGPQSATLPTGRVQLVRQHAGPPCLGPSRMIRGTVSHRAMNFSAHDMQMLNTTAAIR